MHAQCLLCAVALLGAFVTVLAAPNPMPTPLLEEKRQCVYRLIFHMRVVTDIIYPSKHPLGGLTFLAGSIISDAASIFTEVTSVGGKAFTVITEAGHDAFTLATGRWYRTDPHVKLFKFRSIFVICAGGVVTSIAGSVFTVATAAGGSIAGKVFTDITSLGGHEYTVVSDQVGHIATLAVSGAGVVTSAGASVYTAATSLPTNTVGSQSAARLATSAPWLPAPIIIVLGSVAAGAMLGAGTVI